MKQRSAENDLISQSMQCDRCGQLSLGMNWVLTSNKPSTSYVMTELNHKASVVISEDPKRLKVTRTYIDSCDPCFREHAMPALSAAGFKFNVEEEEY